jgi:hypothetical protein
MRRLNLSAVAVLALLIGIQGTNSAGQSAGSSQPRVIAAGFAGAPYQFGGVPRGDYQLTCRDITSNGYTVQARCQKRNGDWRTSSLNYRNCRSQIVNDDGHLRCTQGGGYYGGGREGREGGLPPGDYKLTCRNARANGYRLEATCQKRDGGWRDTSLNYDDCRSRIVNDNGHLRCQR